MKLEDLTEFQVECLKAVEDFLRSKKIPFRTEWTRGERENYLVIHPHTNSSNIVIYLYLDEAGFYNNQEWIIFETPDFDTPQQIIEALLKDLRRWLS